MESITQRARELRKHPTNAEQRLWRLLRDRRLNGYRFRRQRPIGRFVVDFACLEDALIIEVDGNQHALRTAYDAARTRALEARGFRVLRISNREVLREPESVAEAILVALQNPHPNPPPQAREGEETVHAQ